MLRFRLPGTAVYTIALILSACGDSNTGAPIPVLDPSPPHIVVLIADDLGAGYAPCLGNAGHMPKLDGRCGRALVFNRAYTHPICVSSRAAMMTGRHTLRTRSGDVREASFKLGLDEVTIPELIKSIGPTAYHFAGFGKWHLASDSTGGVKNPNLQGFDYFEGTPRQHHTYKYFDYNWWVNGVQEKDRISTYKTTHIVDRVIAHFRKQSKEGPGLYWVGFVNPHLPFHLPPKELHSLKDLPYRNFRSVRKDRISNDLVDNSEDIVHINVPSPKVVPYFHAMVEALDTEISRLVDYISRHSDRPVVFFFLGDNGDAGEVSPHDRTGLRGAKGSLYEAGARVPLMIWSTDPAWEKKYAGVTDRLTHLADLFPTLAEIAGVNIRATRYTNLSVDGVSFAGYISPTANKLENQQIYLQVGNNRRAQFQFAAISQDGHKLILRNLDRERNRGKDPIEFFNLQDDTREANNLFPALCRGNEVEPFWRSFKYIADLHRSESKPYGTFRELSYLNYIKERFTGEGCGFKP